MAPLSFWPVFSQLQVILQDARPCSTFVVPPIAKLGITECLDSRCFFPSAFGGILPFTQRCGESATLGFQVFLYLRAVFGNSMDLEPKRVCSSIFWRHVSVAKARAVAYVQSKPRIFSAP